LGSSFGLSDKPYLRVAFDGFESGDWIFGEMPAVEWNAKGAM
jgi:hypothetical protein